MNCNWPCSSYQPCRKLSKYSLHAGAQRPAVSRVINFIARLFICYGFVIIGFTFSACALEIKTPVAKPRRGASRKMRRACRLAEGLPKDDFIVPCRPEIPNTGFLGIVVLAVERAGLCKVIRA